MKKLIESMIITCENLPMYKVIFALSGKKQMENIRTFLTKYSCLRLDKIYSLINTRDSCRIAFENGSTIWVYPINDNCRGFRANAILYDKHLDESLVDNVAIPMAVNYSNINGVENMTTLIAECDFSELEKEMDATNDAD